ncbi:hypothetical protein Aduo_006702 [Ancylostoma duodenale]
MDNKDHASKSRENTATTPGSDSTANAPQRVGPTPRATSADSRSSSRGTPQREAGGAKSTSVEGYEGSKEGFAQEQETMEGTDTGAEAQPVEKESGAAVNIIRSPFKDSAMLDPKAVEGEMNIMDLVDRYEEQPTMVDAPLRRPPPKKGGTPGISEETVFDNIEDDKSGRTKSEKALLAAKRKEQGGENYPYDNLGEDAKAEEEEDYGKDNETYENLPTPPNEKEKKKEKKEIKPVAKTAVVRKGESAEMHTAERIQTRHDQKRKRGLVSDRTLATEKALNEMMTQMEGKSLKELQEELELDETAATGLLDMLEDEELMETAISTPQERATRSRIRLRRRRLRQAKPTVGKTILDILSITCLLSLMNDYWIVPVKAVENGGLAFVLIYFLMLVILVYPVLNLVLFVSQYTQTGIINVFKMYGPLFEGIGYGYMVLVFMVQMKIIHQGAILLKHISFTFSDNLSIGTCSEIIVEDWVKCTSIFLDSHCMAKNRSYSFYSQGFCWNISRLENSAAITSTQSYLSFLFESDYGYGFDFGITQYKPPFLHRESNRVSQMFVRYLIQLSAIAVFAANGPMVMIAFLAILMILFLMLIIADNLFAFNRNSLALLLRLSNFQKLLALEPWVTALRLAFSSSGLGEVTVFCMSSFRTPRGKYFLTSTAVVFGKILVSVIGLFSLVNDISILDMRAPNHKRAFSSKNTGLTYSPAHVVDVYSMFSDFSHRLFDHAELVYIYHIVTSFAAVFMMYALARKHEADTFIERVPFVGAYIIFCCFYSFIDCLDIFQVFAHRHKSLILGCSLYFYMALTIFILTFCYGIKEYHNDVNEIFPRANSTLRKLREIPLTIAFLLSVIALLVTEGKKWELAQEFMALALAIIPFILPILFCLFRFFRSKKKVNWLELSNDHPTQQRITGIAMGKMAKRRRLGKKKLPSKRTQKLSEHATGDSTFDDATRNDATDLESADGKDQDEDGRFEVLDPKQAEQKLPSQRTSTEGNQSKSAEKAANKNESKSTEKVGNKNESKSAEKVGNVEGRKGQSNEKLRSKEGIKRK